MKGSLSGNMQSHMFKSIIQRQKLPDYPNVHYAFKL